MQWRRLLGLVAFVLLAHAVVLAVLEHYLAQPTVLKPMVAPLFTRVLQPQAPPPVVVASSRRAARAEPSRPAITSVTQSTPAATTTVAPAKPPPDSAPPAAEGAAPADAAPDVSAARSTPAVTETTTAAAPAHTDESVPGLTPDPSVPGSATATTSGVASTTPGAGSSTVTGTGTTTLALDSWPRDTRLSYRLSGQLRGGELYGDARVQWQRDGAHYQVQVDVNVTPWARLVMTSQGEVTADGLSPRAYEESRRGKPRGLRLGEREVMLANGDVVRRPAGVQDTASQFVELSHRFASGRERLEVGRSVNFWMARPGAIDLWTYDIIEREVLKTPTLGLVEAFRLKPRPIANPRGNILAEMWFAPSLQYLPVRIRVSMGEEAHVDLLVDKIEQR